MTTKRGRVVRGIPYISVVTVEERRTDAAIETAERQTNTVFHPMFRKMAKNKPLFIKFYGVAAAKKAWSLPPFLVLMEIDAGKGQSGLFLRASIDVESR
jgi:hypothetical protein